jgi:hypothetical protein
LTPFDLRLGHEQKPRGLRGCGKVPDFLPFASASAEHLRKTAEDQLGPAIGAARAGRLHDQEAHVQAVMDTVALHLVRSHRYLEMHRAVSEQSIEFVRQDALRSRAALLRAEFQRRHNLVPAGPQPLAASMVAAWECRNRRQVVSVLRFGAGGIRSALRTRRHVDVSSDYLFLFGRDSSLSQDIDILDSLRPCLITPMNA